MTEPPRRLAIVGAGYIGLELGTVFAKLGSEVVIIEAADSILPGFDAELSAPVSRWLEKSGVIIHLRTRATKLSENSGSFGLQIQDRDGRLSMLPVDLVLVAVGRRPRLDGWGFENLPLDRDQHFIRVDETCRTSMRGVYAIGDLTGEPLLAHKASAQGEMVAEVLAGRRCRFAPVAIPAVCFTEPEIVSVGVTPSEASIKHLPIIVGRTPFAANGRALTLESGADGGFVRVVAQADSQRVLGVQAVGAHVSELSAAFVTAIEMGAVLEDVVGSIQAHPTLGETFRESALDALRNVVAGNESYTRQKLA